MKALFPLSLLLLVTGCGANPSAKTATGTGTTTPPPTSTTPTSMWAGTFTGYINVKGCPSVGSCGGDLVFVTITQSVNPAATAEFLPAITVSGTDNGVSFTGTGTAAFTGAALPGPGTEAQSLYFTTSTGLKLWFSGTGSSSTTDPELINSIAVHNLVVVGTASQSGASDYGTINRVATQ